MWIIIIWISFYEGHRLGRDEFESFSFGFHLVIDYSFLWFNGYVLLLGNLSSLTSTRFKSNKSILSRCKKRLQKGS